MKGDYDINLWVKIISLISGMVIFCFTTFSTKDEVRGTITERLNRIENKIDHIYEYKTKVR